MSHKSKFAGGDQDYLRDVQYGNGSKLDVRVSLHRRFSTATVQMPEFEAGLISWPEAADVLECGTGTGQFWINPITPKSARLTLTDLSQGMVDRAVAEATANGFGSVGSVEGQACDVQSLPFPDESFDVVVANHMLYHVPDPDRGVAELSRVLRPDGVLLCATNGYGHMDVVQDVTAEALTPHNDGLYEVFGIDTGERRLRERFARVSWHAYDNDLVVDDPAAVVAYILSYPPGETATADEAASVAAAVDRRMVDGEVHIRVRTGAFVCRKPRVR